MKTILSSKELIEHMEHKGIKFNIVSTEDAYEFLQCNNYYFKLAAYRSLYPKISRGDNKGKYQNLEFAYLKELSVIDMHIRYKIMNMCLDIEHAIKVRLVTSVTNNQQEDGYDIIRQYLSKEDPKFYVLKNIGRHKSGEYCRDLISKYYPYFPVWVLVELITFGDLLHICHFYEEEYHRQIIPDNKLMNTVRDLRNASAHSNCLLNQLNQRLDNNKQPDSRIVHFVEELGVIGETSRRNNLTKNFSYDMVTLLYVYASLMPDVSRKEKFKELKDFMEDRVLEHKEYFKNNSEIKSVYSFLYKIIDKLSTQD
ncbi:Abi family protein [Limosilactobacillus sp. STM2_1]|uniref:Abi family protein n=1 Tax=Limosilactobacillus rudii TaxID=2759755 RepID=A0A7W3YNH9_9LACO|nr:Abi family protein [Limosilactobacillus rudii]MBB1078783.1 Abi family protein [Limosilactobacillus rudii]MBB1097665.1 Abi family protein [Limosilactobacillus rudii]MCD7134774.1 Abi family protein [Limosilactobacillus rudii]